MTALCDVTKLQRSASYNVHTKISIYVCVAELLQGSSCIVSQKLLILEGHVYHFIMWWKTSAASRTLAEKKKTMNAYTVAVCTHLCGYQGHSTHKFAPSALAWVWPVHR